MVLTKFLLLPAFSLPYLKQEDLEALALHASTMSRNTADTLFSQTHHARAEAPAGRRVAVRERTAFLSTRSFPIEAIGETLATSGQETRRSFSVTNAQIIPFPSGGRGGYRAARGRDTGRDGPKYILIFLAAVGAVTAILVTAAQIAAHSAPALILLL
jgi:hypothetical protein